MGANAEPLELTILMPCLNEAETLGQCILNAERFLDEQGIAGEILIADNGSSDGSPAIAEDSGARVVLIPEKGYGGALMGVDLHKSSERLNAAYNDTAGVTAQFNLNVLGRVNDPGFLGSADPSHT